VGSSYPGGKNGAGVFQTIINGMPPHGVYLEPFLGGGAVMRLKRPARLNIGLDLDPDVVRSFGCWPVGTLPAPSAVFGDASSRRPPSPVPARGSGHAGFGEGAPRFKFFRGDAFDFLRGYSFTGTELVYCDPPYMHETRGRADLYRYELRDWQHRDLLKIIKRLPCAVMISGYWTALYAEYLKKWRLTTFNTTNRAGALTTECVWSNFPEPVALHDYRYLGDGFRERERIKRKKNRWVRRLERIDGLERRALLAAIAEAWRVELAV
jgi:hypothetical protein